MHHSFHTGPVPRVRCLPLAFLTQQSCLNARLREREAPKLTQLSGLGARLPEQEGLKTGIYFQQVDFQTRNTHNLSITEETFSINASSFQAKAGSSKLRPVASSLSRARSALSLSRHLSSLHSCEIRVQLGEQTITAVIGFVHPNKKGRRCTKDVAQAA